jgi:ribose/xylose/arabinose/galactoside ABC-type transport system permease subunit
MQRGKLLLNFFRLREQGIVLALIFLFIGFSLTTPHFLRATNLLNVLRQVSLLGIIAVGMTMTIISGEIDLSVGAVYGIAAVTCGLLARAGYPIWLAMTMAVAIGMLVGFSNGLLVNYVKISSLIVTLGMLNVVRGSYLLVTGGLPVFLSAQTVPDPNLPAFFFLGQGKIADLIPMLAVFFIGVVIFGYIICHRSLFGFNLRAVGGNARAARASGISVEKTKVLAFVLVSTLSAVAGILNLSFLSSVQGIVGSGLELDVIAATVIGGTSLAGGEGTILGTVIGVLIIGVLRNGLVLLGISPFWQTALIGGIIIGAAAIDAVTRRTRG